jgi:hypothetical protein
MRKFIAGSSLDPVEGNVYVIVEDTGEPDRVVILKEKITDDNVGNYPIDSQSKVEFVNKVLTDKGIDVLTDEEIEFVKAS